MTTAAARQGLPFKITAGDGGEARGFLLDVEQVTWRTIPITRQGVDQGAGPGEQALSNEAIWRRSRDNLFLGAGQDYADLLEDESSPHRFRTSDAIDCWTKRALTPLPTVANKLASAATNLALLPARVGATDYLVAMDGAAVRYTSDPDAAVPTWTDHTGLGGGTLSSITSDGRRWWVCDGANIYQGTPGTAAAAAFSTYDADLVGYANGRLLAANGAELVEILAAGTTRAIFTHPNADFVWRGIAASPGGIYVWGDVGDRSDVYVVTAIDVTGQLDVPFIAAFFPDGEHIHAMTSYAGVMAVATSRGLRLALVSGGGFLSNGPVIEDAGEILALEPQGEDLWFSWTVDATTNGLGRARLSTWTADLVPAFAPDLMARGASVSGDVLSVVTVAGRRYFAVSGRGVYGETTTYEGTATIDLGWFTYGIPEEKVADSITVWCDALPAGCSIVADVYADDSAVALITMTMDADGTKKQTATYGGDTVAERLRVVLTVTQAGATPVTIRRVTLRAAPKPFVSEILTLPLVLTEAIQAENVGQIGQDPWYEWSILHDLLTTRARCTVTVGSHSFDARIEGLEVEKGGLGGGNGLNGWDDRLQFLEGRWDVTFITLEPAAVA